MDILYRFLLLLPVVFYCFHINLATAWLLDYQQYFNKGPNNAKQLKLTGLPIYK